MKKVLSFKTKPITVHTSFHNTWYWGFTGNSGEITFNVGKIKCFVTFLRKIKLYQ